MSFGKMGLLHRQLGDAGQALDALRQGQRIMARLTNLSPDNAGWKQDLAESDADIDGISKTQDHP
jgi:hypothetical protein